MRLVFITMSVFAAALPLCAGGCASERLDATGPSGINLSGRWKYNPNLSDEADKQADTDQDHSHPASPSRRRGNRGGAGGPGPYGGSGASPWYSDQRQSPAAGSSVNTTAPGRMLSVGLPPSAPDGSTPLPPAGPASSTGSGSGRLSRMLPAATYLLITQEGARVNIRSNMADGTVTSEDFIAGQKITVPLGEETAERAVGWRGPVFVVTTVAKKGGEIENDYALDDSGRLIVATELRGGHLKRAVDIKRVYDRVDRSENGK